MRPDMLGDRMAEGSAGPSPSDLTLCHNIDFGRARFDAGSAIAVPALDKTVVVFASAEKNAHR